MGDGCPAVVKQRYPKVHLLDFFPREQVIAFVCNRRFGFTGQGKPLLPLKLLLNIAASERQYLSYPLLIRVRDLRDSDVKFTSLSIPYRFLL